MIASGEIIDLKTVAGLALLRRPRSVRSCSPALAA